MGHFMHGDSFVIDCDKGILHQCDGIRVRIVLAVTRVVIVIVEIGVDIDSHEALFELFGDGLVSVAPNPDGLGHEAYFLHLRGMQEGYDVVLNGHGRLPSWMQTPIASCESAGTL
jgi:hypothetical protein